jgi:hypothetical protein
VGNVYLLYLATSAPGNNPSPFPFTLSAPGSTNNPWTPAGIVTLGGNGLKSDATGFRAQNFAYTPFGHPGTYGPTIVSTATLATTSSGADIFLGDLVSTGANAGAMIAAWITATSCIFGTMNPGGTFTSLSTATTITHGATDLFAATVGISGGTATLTLTQNGTPVTFSANTTTTYATESSIISGCAFLPNASNGTYLSQFTSNV